MNNHTSSRNFKLIVFAVFAMSLFGFNSAQALSISIGTTIGKHPPKGAAVVKVGKTRYHYHNGHYYKKGKHGYIVVKAPRGATVRRLPKGYKRVVINGRRYFHHNGVYYRHHANGYIVVDFPGEEAPTDSETAVHNPTEVFVLDSHQYEFVDNEFFQITPNGLVWSETPFGAIAIHIPEDCETVWHNEIEYFTKGKLVLRKTPEGYQIVPTPWK